MKRFYKEVTTAAADGGWQVKLDGRGIKTAGKQAQVVPSEKLAQAMAREWEDQGEELDPAAFPLRDQVDYAIDIVAIDRDAAIEKLLAFAQTDTLCYRADPGEALYRRQEEMWEPLLNALEVQEDIRFDRVSGIIHRAQPDASLAKLRARLATYDDFTLAGLQVMASLAASLCVALAALEPGAEAEKLWEAANLEEDWQAQLWGQDAEAAETRTRRLAEFTRALEFVRLVRAG